MNAKVAAKDCTIDEIRRALARLETMLIGKNQRYGDSALEPLRIFSRSDRLEQIRVRIDDKLSRVARGVRDDDEDVVNDLIGYLILLVVAEERARRAG